MIVDADDDIVLQMRSVQETGKDGPTDKYLVHLYVFR